MARPPLRPVRLHHESFGDPARPAVLLIMGLSNQLLGWEQDLCRRLAPLTVIRGMGHGLPEAAWEPLLEAIEAKVARGEP